MTSKETLGVAGMGLNPRLTGKELNLGPRFHSVKQIDPQVLMKNLLMAAYICGPLDS